jgi:hypothetical protein
VGDFEIEITELLHCMRSFSPNYFSAYICPAWLAGATLSYGFLRERVNSTSISTYSFHADMRTDEWFKNLKNIIKLSIMLV